MRFDLTGTLQATEAVQKPAHQPPAQAQHKTSFWHELISQVASLAGINPNLAVSVAAQESGMNPNAVNPTSGAVGMMQLMPGTAAALGVNPHDVMGNIVGGVRYLREQLASFGDEVKALAAYNWGPRHVTDAVERWGSDWLSHAPLETQRYVASILSRTSTAGTAEIGPAATPASSPHPPAPALAAQAASLRSLLDAYLLSEVLG